MYDAVLELLTDLQLGGRRTQAIDNHASTLIKNICEYFTRLNITQMSLNQDEHLRNVTITAASNGREIVLASLTSSELMSSTADLAEHILHMLQMQSPQMRSPQMRSPQMRSPQMRSPQMRSPQMRSPQMQSTSTGLVGEPSFQAQFTPQYHGHLRWATDHMDSQTMPIAQQHGLTYAPAFQLRSPQLQSTLRRSADDPPIQTDFTPQGNGHLSWATAHMGSQTMPSTQRYGLTYPSALLDDTNVPGCAIPSAACF